MIIHIFTNTITQMHLISKSTEFSGIFSARIFGLEAASCNLKPPKNNAEMSLIEDLHGA
jgi:hypothetical protein